MSTDLLRHFRDEYQQAPADTYTDAMHRELYALLASMDDRIRALEATVASLDKAAYRALNPNP